MSAGVYAATQPQGGAFSGNPHVTETHSLLSVWQGSTVKNIIFGLKQGSKCSGMDGSDLVKSLLTRLSREIMHSDQSSKFGQKY